jgi:uncharacterized protein YqgV (UPF0045/DUF77 family)
MYVSAAISMYPLDSEYGTYILRFIDRMSNYPDLETRVNRMSTEVFGPYDRLMEVLGKEIRVSFSEGCPLVVVIKLMNEDMR